MATVWRNSGDMEGSSLTPGRMSPGLCSPVVNFSMARPSSARSPMESTSKGTNGNMDYFSLNRNSSHPAATPATHINLPTSTPLPYLTPAAPAADSPSEYFTPMIIPTTPSHGPANLSQRTPIIRPIFPPATPGALPPRVPPSSSNGGDRSQFRLALPVPNGAAIPAATNVVPQDNGQSYGSTIQPRGQMHLPLPSPRFNLSLPVTPKVCGSPNSPPEPHAFEPIELANLLHAQGSPRPASITSAEGNPLVLVLDMRSFVQYSRQRVKSSVNVCIPTTLLKRPTFGADKLFDTLASDHAKDMLKQWTNNTFIILYDNDSSQVSSGSPLMLLARKLQQGNTTATIGWLRGGCTEFCRNYPDLCDNSPPPVGSEGIGSPPGAAGGQGLALPNLAGMGMGLTATGATPAKIRGGLNLSLDLSGLGPLTAPSALGALAASRPPPQPTYAAHTSVPSKSPTEILKDATVDPADVNVPLFLRELFQKENVKGAIEENFNAVEAAEKKRLDCSFRARTRTDPFSVSDALEAGATRNRYNNIWPFNHNRVRLHTPTLPSVQPSTAAPGSDYINASHIVSPAGHRTYIATQGPIPSTFEDFWRMVWEQESGVILMLCADADVQRGSQTCHKYWPEESTPVLKLNRVEVTLLKESNISWGQDDKAKGSDMVVRCFKVVVDGQDASAREIYQIQYLGWPDHGVPDHPDEMLRIQYLADKLHGRLAKQSSSMVGPMVVHCSAGCGRTGAFICVDAVLALLKHSDTPFTSSTPTPPESDPQSWSIVRPILTPTTFSSNAPHDMILASVHHLRSQRILMVQSLSQFAFCYEVVGRFCRVSSLHGYEDIVMPPLIEKLLDEVFDDMEGVVHGRKRERNMSTDDHFERLKRVGTRGTE
ncbi:uncharacterized protein SPPG_07048 [Spizellomyces punctatus DAOM BR117]|uniref:protein-tyrosine-phosphatase n=1 Tax=Spizellomyces punctatus (strain DAOM BR117) TaxID=645134 RepID=A0A0L0H7U0_SPIPD|nr:hypothetical protein, variant [Spizellomyces punctatus DAOM BR117]XP_016605616.1 uncharacterized protein SPPG_07048 [Spizellomyces punctatus DAOM BR117]KNC97575.1 hypothetical protein, variant [Spizellomyces punctatus DAOM BR117]KNC97576.1 hypothetical protein SPPG_07048 [Spizellomyces punctatus DAOM BR117]|eukprot:XP_016605615.1 hypothetical protein, variant [Spizellomyces punctatus DAOM BR117]